MNQPAMTPLTSEQLQHFIVNGFVKLESAFPSTVADECRSILWNATGCDPEDRATWTQPVIRIGELADEPFRAAANTPGLHQAFDQLAGVGNWTPRTTIGSFPIRFPSEESAPDTGWHVDASFPGDDPADYFQWRVNVHSKGRALLMLFLFSDVGDRDAPTLIRRGSHLEVARMLQPHGTRGLSFMELAAQVDQLPSRELDVATGEAGTVYLCHPFLVHAAQQHHGQVPKFMAQPPLLSKEDFSADRVNIRNCAVSKAIRYAFEK